MTAISTSAGVLTSALGRFERASLRRLEAAIGAGEAEDAITPVAEIMQAKVQAKAGVAGVRFSDLMWEALIDLQSRRDRGKKRDP